MPPPQSYTTALSYYSHYPLLRAQEKCHPHPFFPLACFGRRPSLFFLFLCWLVGGGRRRHRSRSSYLSPLLLAKLGRVKSPMDNKNSTVFYVCVSFGPFWVKQLWFEGRRLAPLPCVARLSCAMLAVGDASARAPPPCVCGWNTLFFVLFCGRPPATLWLLVVVVVVVVAAGLYHCPCSPSLHTPTSLCSSCPLLIVCVSTNKPTRPSTLADCAVSRGDDL